jgi:hypothetical protein
VLLHRLPLSIILDKYKERERVAGLTRQSLHEEGRGGTKRAVKDGNLLPGGARTLQALGPCPQQHFQFHD